MLRALSVEEVAFVSGGMFVSADSFDDDSGGGGGDDGGFVDGDNYGGGFDDPGQVAGPPDTTDSPKYDSSTDPNSYNYGHDSSNTYERGSANGGNSGGTSNSQLGNYSPSSSPSSPPSIGGPNPTPQGPSFNFGGGVSGGAGTYNLNKPSQGAGIRGKAQL